MALLDVLKRKLKIRKDLYPGIPAPQANEDSLQSSVQALKIGYEQLTRGRGDIGTSAVLVDELTDLVHEIAAQITLNKDLIDPDLLSDAEEFIEKIQNHIDDTDIHFGDAPNDGDSYLRRGKAWVRYVAGDWRQVIDDKLIVLNKTWSSTKLNQMFVLLENLINQHIFDKTNPHEVMHDQLTDVTADQHHNQVHLLYGPDHTDVDSTAPAVEADGLYWNGTDFATNRRTRYIPDGYVEGNEYQRGDELSNGGQLVECLVDGATEFPFISPTEDPFYVYDGTTTNLQNIAKQVIFGNRWTFDEGGYANGYRINTVVGNRYRILSVADPLGTPRVNELVAFTANASGFQEFSITPVVILPNDSFDLIAIVQEPDPTPSTFVGDWNYTIPNNVTPPLAGQISHSTKASGVLSVSYTDNDLADRTVELQALLVGDIIDSGTLRWSIQSSSDKGTYIDFAVAPAVQDTPQGVKEFTFETVVATPITVEEDIDYWLLNPPVSGSAQGIIAVDDSYENATLNDTYYAVEPLFQRAYIPTQWKTKILGASIGGSTPTVEPPGQIQTSRVVTIDNSWTTIFSQPMSPGDWYKIITTATAKRIDGTDDYYTSSYVSLVWLDGALAQEDGNMVYELGNILLSVRVGTNGNNFELQVRGRNNQTWEWDLRKYIVTYGL